MDRKIAVRLFQISCFSIHYSLILLLFTVLCFSENAQAEDNDLMQVYYDFSTDPGWEGRNNLPKPEDGQSKKQDFGYQQTNHAGGKTGEIGGCIYRSLRPASYLKPIPTRSLNDHLHASGKFSVPQSHGGSGALIGWFHHTSRGWRTPNSLAFRIDGESNEFRVFFEYGTQTWKTGGGETFEGPYQTTTTPMHKADGSPHTWTLDYDPAGAGGTGEITFTLDGKTYKAPLAAGHKAEGAKFDRFGIMNQQISGDKISIYIDDLTVDGESEDFSNDPGWVSIDSHIAFDDFANRPIHDFGYRNTNHAGGKPGEIGGLVWRIESMLPERALYYGTPSGYLSLDDNLKASGKVCLQAAAADSGILVGWFNELTPIGNPPQNFLGIFIEGPSRVGHYFRPVYGTSEDLKGGIDSGPVIRPDGNSHDWTFEYFTDANGGNGSIMVTLDGESIALNLQPGARKGNAAFTRFGMLSWQRGGHFVDIYFDDISFTARKTEKER